MILIGENINIMSVTIGPALRERNPKPIQELAKAEVRLVLITLTLTLVRLEGQEMS